MEKIEVVAAIISENNKFLSTQRGYGDFKGGWEFPGGKIELGETKEEALKREIVEELGIEIHINQLLHTIEYDYPNFHLIMYCYLCNIKKGELILLEHEAARWLTKQELESVDWLPADLELINILKTL